LARKVIVITGAAGFIGSSLVVTLSGENNIVAIDHRKPNRTLISAAPAVKWIMLNIANARRVNRTFQNVKEEFGEIDFVIHLAAFYHFGNDWRVEYENTNIRGTENVIYSAINSGVQRIIFTSSIAAIEPPPYGQLLNEYSPASDYIPYAKSKSAGEEMIKNAADKIQGIVLRLGGVFSDWCELPPLYSLIRLWSSIKPFSKMIPGRGDSGIPYIHLHDVIKIIKCCITKNNQLGPYEIFMASQYGTFLHKDLFQSVQQTLHDRKLPKPVFISPGLVKISLKLKSIFGPLVNIQSFEQPWMLKYIDRPWVVNNIYTQERLEWNCTPKMTILEKVPVILNLFKTQRNKWIDKNVQRNLGNYVYTD
jgi:nucleoside-diphosphate-sugar epimerase